MCCSNILVILHFPPLSHLLNRLDLKCILPCTSYTEIRCVKSFFLRIVEQFLALTRKVLQQINLYLILLHVRVYIVLHYFQLPKNFFCLPGSIFLFFPGICIFLPSIQVSQFRLKQKKRSSKYEEKFDKTLLFLTLMLQTSRNI